MEREGKVNSPSFKLCINGLCEWKEGEFLRANFAKGAFANVRNRIREPSPSGSHIGQSSDNEASKEGGVTDPQEFQGVSNGG